jgi:hypothetical protein
MDILTILFSQRQKNIVYFQDNLLKEAYSILQGDSIGNKSSSVNYFDEQNETVLTAKPIALDQNRIFSTLDIKGICIDYRLRFLDLKHYKAQLPYDVHIKATAFEMEAGHQVTFKVLSEAQNFKSTFPFTQQLLFADLGNGEFYFIHKWGNEYPSYRKYTAMPYKSIEALFGLIVMISSFLAIVTPTNFITSKPHIDYFSMIRIAYFFWCIIAFSALFVYYIVAIRKGMNSAEWDNPSMM